MFCSAIAVLNKCMQWKRYIGESYQKQTCFYRSIPRLIDF